MQQRSDEWFQARCGKVTASKVADVIAKTKSGYAAARANYMAQLIAERLTGQPAESYCNAAMQWGIDTEPHARAAYEFHTDNSVTEVGLILHPEIADSAASPDGLVGDEGLVEIKCPNTATHIDTLINQRMPTKYVAQMQWQMACTGRQWCDFVSFDPRMPEDMRLFVFRLPRDDGYIGDVEREVEKFLKELETKINQLQELAA